MAAVNHCGPSQAEFFLPSNCYGSAKLCMLFSPHSGSTFSLCLLWCQEVCACCGSISDSLHQIPLSPPPPMDTIPLGAAQTSKLRSCCKNLQQNPMSHLLNNPAERMELWVQQQNLFPIDPYQPCVQERSAPHQVCVKQCHQAAVEMECSAPGELREREPLLLSLSSCAVLSWRLEQPGPQGWQLAPSCWLQWALLGIVFLKHTLETCKKCIHCVF